MNPARSLMVFVPGIAVCALFAGLLLFTAFRTPRNSPNESALLPIDGSPDDLIEAIIEKQGGREGASPSQYGGGGDMQLRGTREIRRADHAHRGSRSS
jgi:hypothetical protein